MDRKLKIYVYAICKNEEKFVRRFYNSVREADGIYVLDTGSTDDTVKYLKSLDNVYVKKKIIKPWRFDTARNESLKMVPTDADICICMDLDEVMMPGWRQVLERLWSSDITRLKFNYNWSLDKNDNPIINFYIEKIHARNGYKWVHPVHEVLEYDGIEKVITTDDITVNHYPDQNKSRESYLKLLELSVKESPEDDRNMHYLGREYMYYKRWNDSIDTLIKHLKLKSATWKDERCASMRFIARCYKNLGRYEEAALWAEKAINEAPYLREGYMERCLIAYETSDWINTLSYALRALDKNSKNKTYINEAFTLDSFIYDMISIASYNLGYMHEAVYFVNLALEENPSDERLLGNKKLFENKIKENN